MPLRVLLSVLHLTFISSSSLQSHRLLSKPNAARARREPAVFLVSLTPPAHLYWPRPIPPPRVPEWWV
eukprot:2006077-Pyramimonas_sp.AAC.1